MDRKKRKKDTLNDIKISTHQVCKPVEAFQFSESK